MGFNQYEILNKFDNQGFPKIDHSGCTARIVLEQNEFSKKVTSNRDWTRDPTTLVALLLQSHVFPNSGSVAPKCIKC